MVAARHRRRRGRAEDRGPRADLGRGERPPLERCRELALLRLYTGRYGPFPSVEEAEQFPYTARDIAIIEATRGRTIASGPR